MSWTATAGNPPEAVALEVEQLREELNRLAADLFLLGVQLEDLLEGQQIRSAATASDAEHARPTRLAVRSLPRPQASLPDDATELGLEAFGRERPQSDLPAPRQALGPTHARQAPELGVGRYSPASEESRDRPIMSTMVETIASFYRRLTVRRASRRSTSRRPPAAGSDSVRVIRTLAKMSTNWMVKEKNWRKH